MSTDLALTWDHGKYEFHRKLGSFVQYFQVNLPTNAYGVPLKIVDPLAIVDSLLTSQTTDDIPDEVLQRALVDVDYDDGLPIVGGVPLWERLDGESVEYYKLFKEYREALYVSGARAIAKLSETFKIAGKYLNALAKVYHWQLRCKAYDAFKRMERERKRMFEIEKLESKHAKAADAMMEQALTYLENHPEQMNPKVAVQMMQLAMKAGRLALGLNPDKPGSNDGTPNISIHQTATSANGAETSSTVEISGQGSQPQPGTQVDVSHLQSILHILDKSGALDKAKIVDADYSVVDEDEASA